MIQADVAILGGGLVGGVTAIALAQAGFRVVVVDREAQQTHEKPELDGRTTAVCYSSQQMFSALGIWKKLEDQAEPILTIKVFEGNSPWSITFDHSQIGDHPMGYILENRLLRQAIHEQANHHTDKITWLAPTEILTKKITKAGVTLYLKSGEEINTPLYIGAEGRHSLTRQEADIKIKTIDYQQKALVFSIYHENPHNNIAWEVFYPEGPMAFLPISKCPESGRFRSGVVWTLPTDQADYWYEQPNELIAEKIHELFSFLGPLSLIGTKWCYPLSAQVVEGYVGERCVIIGDAAHVCHPVAGQGVNIGWRDAAVLCDVLCQARRLGSDLGSQITLKQYQRQRRVDTLSIFAMTDTMVRLFSNNSSILFFLRNAGLGIVNQLSPLKKFFMRHAMGIGGKLPPLLQGKHQPR